MNCRGCGRKRFWTNLRHNYDTFFAGLKKEGYFIQVSWWEYEIGGFQIGNLTTNE
jgi:hypothetical protein